MPPPSARTRVLVGVLKKEKPAAGPLRTAGPNIDAPSVVVFPGVDEPKVEN